MATNMSSNKLVWVLVGVLALVVGVAVVNSGDQKTPKQQTTAATDNKVVDTGDKSAAKQKASDSKADKQSAQPHPKSGKDDGDTVTETLKEVKARYEVSQDENDKLKKSQDELLRRLSALESKANKPAQDNISSDPRVQEFMSRLESAEKDIGSLAKNVVEGKSEKSATESSHYSNGYEISNNDLGWGDTGGAAEQGSSKSKKGMPIGPQAMPGYVLVQPMTRSQLMNTDPKLAEKMLRDKLQGLENGLADGKTSIEKSPLTNTLKKSAGGKITAEVKQYRTIPKRATGFEAVAMTAMIGTVPVGGKIQDPFPVKLILGDDNFSSNGMGIPGLKGIVIDGIARGNWNLSCVSVTLTGATFTFADGRVQPMDFNRDQGKENGSGGGDSKNNIVSPFAENEGSRGIGYISNPQGVPCIPGRRITDAHKQLFTMGVLGAGKSYFDAKAAAETTSTRNPLGGSSSDVTGDKATFVNNTTYANTVGTVMDFYSKRMRDSFDVIYAEPNQKVMVHFTQDLYVDYHSDQRKLTYAAGGKNGNSMD